MVGNAHVRIGRRLAGWNHGDTYALLLLHAPPLQLVAQLTQR